MDSHNAFERQLADEIDYEVGPPRNVDALAIARQAKTTSPRWRFNKMSSTFKFAAAGSLLALAGATFLLVVPIDRSPQDGTVVPPGAEHSSEPSAEPSPSPWQDSEIWYPVPEEFSATWELGSKWSSGLVAGFDSENISTDTGSTWRASVVEVSDPRLDGTVTISPNSATYGGPNGPTLIHTSFHITNDGGTWQMDPYYQLESPDGSRTDGTGVFVGAGDYEGLIAVVEIDQDPEAETWALSGFVIEGSAPEAPERPIQ